MSDAPAHLRTPSTYAPTAPAPLAASPAPLPLPGAADNNSAPWDRFKARIQAEADLATASCPDNVAAADKLMRPSQHADTPPTQPQHADVVGASPVAAADNEGDGFAGHVSPPGPDTYHGTATAPRAPASRPDLRLYPYVPLSGRSYALEGEGRAVYYLPMSQELAEAFHEAGGADWLRELGVQAVQAQQEALQEVLALFNPANISALTREQARALDDAGETMGAEDAWLDARAQAKAPQRAEVARQLAGVGRHPPRDAAGREMRRPVQPPRNKYGWPAKSGYRFDAGEAVAKHLNARRVGEADAFYDLRNLAWTGIEGERNTVLLEELERHYLALLDVGGPNDPHLATLMALRRELHALYAAPPSRHPDDETGVAPVDPETGLPRRKRGRPAKG